MQTCTMSGLELLGADMVAHFPDDLHPNGHATGRLGLRFVTRTFGTKSLLIQGGIEA